MALTSVVRVSKLAVMGVGLELGVVGAAVERMGDVAEKSEGVWSVKMCATDMRFSVSVPVCGVRVSSEG